MQSTVSEKETLRFFDLKLYKDVAEKLSVVIGSNICDVSGSLMFSMKMFKQSLTNTVALEIEFDVSCFLLTLFGRPS